MRQGGDSRDLANNRVGSLTTPAHPTSPVGYDNHDSIIKVDDPDTVLALTLVGNSDGCRFKSTHALSRCCAGERARIGPSQARRPISHVLGRGHVRPATEG